MPKMRFVRDAWDKPAGSVVDLPEDFCLQMEQEGVAVRVDEQPKVERAVAPEAKKETANVKR